MENLEDLITQAEAARIRNVSYSREAIYRLVVRGKLETREIGGQKFVSRKKVENYKPDKGGRPTKMKNEK
jgi:hypothetical protein